MGSRKLRKAKELKISQVLLKGILECAYEAGKRLKSAVMETCTETDAC